MGQLHRAVSVGNMASVEKLINFSQHERIRQEWQVMGPGEWQEEQKLLGTARVYHGETHPPACLREGKGHA